MISDRKEKIAHSFGCHANDYDRLGTVQRDVAQRLAAELPELECPSILEVGCGTGFLTKYLYDLYPDASRFVITDLSQQMLNFCQKSMTSPPSASFRILDGEYPDIAGPFDLIVSSMTIQWFDDPYSGIQKLSKYLSTNGVLYFAALGPDNFPEWKASVEAAGNDSGLLISPSLPGIFQNYKPVSHFDSALDFLRYLKRTGAQNPKPDYRNLTDTAIKEACEYFDQTYKGKISWHIVFGSVDCLFAKS